MAETQWYVVHTYSGYEKKVADTIKKTFENRSDLKELFTDVRVPLEHVVELTDKSEKKEYDRKVFPGYVMVKMVVTDETWYIVRNTRGVTGFVSPSSNKPIPLTPHEVTAMGLDKDDVAAVSDDNLILNFKIGDTVRINDGPLEGFPGKVVDILKDMHQAVLSVQMFGRITETTVDISQVSRED
ncbi:MAG: transcription termination/antitermination protein NusG [Ruminococcus sp.]|jgi:transcriptional antiterminator NusG|nr:transcription termination/antitermination protein NusG [Ruminococcus sp.]